MAEYMPTSKVHELIDSKVKEVSDELKDYRKEQRETTTTLFSLVQNLESDLTSLLSTCSAMGVKVDGTESTMKTMIKLLIGCLLGTLGSVVTMLIEKLG